MAAYRLRNDRTQGQLGLSSKDGMPITDTLSPSLFLLVTLLISHGPELSLREAAVDFSQLSSVGIPYIGWI
jgi:hypothetical protein